jgi:hypothetical protein
MRTTKLIPLLFLIVPCLTVTKNIKDNNVCRRGSCISCSMVNLNQGEYFGLSCNACWKHAREFIDPNNISKGTKCSKTKLTDNCVLAQVGVSPQVCLQCDDGYILSGTSCAKPVNAITNCQSYNALALCGQCQHGYWLQSNGTCEKIPSGSKVKNCLY